MRYAQGPTARATVRVQAPIERVWALVSDVGLPARFSPELRRVAWLDGATGPAVGARFEGHNEHPALGGWRTVCVIVELDAPRAFAWAVLDGDHRFGDSPDPMATWHFALEDGVGGDVLLHHGVRVGPARSGLSLAIDRMPEREEELVAYRLAELRSGIEATLAGVKELAERAP